jgi:short-subunit dehydrogenase
VNVSSIFGLIGAPNYGDYSASKFAVRGFTEALMTELQETGVTAHLVHPGGIATNICKINGEEQEFSKHFLKTTADDIAYHVRAKLLMGSPKIVYGKDSLKTWFASNFIPLKWLSKLVWNEIKPVLDSTPYSKVRRS